MVVQMQVQVARIVVLSLTAVNLKFTLRATNLPLSLSNHFLELDSRSMDISSPSLFY